MSDVAPRAPSPPPNVAIRVPPTQSLRYDEDGNLISYAIAGDMNGDGQVTWRDIDCFTEAQNKCGIDPLFVFSCDGDCLNGDFNGDGEVTWRDVDLFSAAQNADTSGLSSQTFTWDAENRLIRVEPTPGSGGTVPVDALKVEFAYDHMGRRIEKKAWRWTGTYWMLRAHRRFIWSDWLMLVEINCGTGATPADDVFRKYTWGLDLAGLNGQVNSTVAAGGIGGLLAVEDSNNTPITASDDGEYVYLYDANGNVTQVVDWRATVSDGGTGTLGTGWGSNRLVAHYEYGP